MEEGAMVVAKVEPPEAAASEGVAVVVAERVVVAVEVADVAVGAREVVASKVREGATQVPIPGREEASMAETEVGADLPAEGRLVAAVQAEVARVEAVSAVVASAVADSAATLEAVAVQTG